MERTIDSELLGKLLNHMRVMSLCYAEAIHHINNLIFYTSELSSKITEIMKEYNLNLEDGKLIQDFINTELGEITKKEEESSDG